jgi:hypothetical protein
LPFTAYGWAAGYLRSRPLSNNFELFSGSSHGLRLLFRGCPSTEPLHRVLGNPKPHSASLEVFSPSASSRSQQRRELARSANPTALRLQVFSTSWRLHPPRACRPCFMPDPLLGCTLQSLVPPAQPFVVPNAVPLLAFEPPSGSFSAREFATRISGLDWIRARSSPGYFSLQGFLPPCDGTAFTAPPLMGLTISDASGRTVPTSGCRSQRDRLASREAAGPPGIFGLLTHRICSSTSGFWSRLLNSPGCVAVPLAALL